MPWGWATYRNEWIKYTGTPKEIYRKCEKKNIDVLKWGKDILWQVEHSDERDLWYIGYALIHFLYNKVSYFPYKSLVVNIGRDGSGVNIGISRHRENFRLMKKPVTVPRSWPKVNIKPGLEKKFATYNNRGHSSWYKLKKILGKIFYRIIGG
jgi:hypothetical protein